jgi:flagellar basal-body rod protein FlgF
MKMQQVLSVALTSMQQEAERMDRIALNLANLATPGYKRQVVAMQPFADLLEGPAPAGPASTAQSPSAGMIVRIDNRNGTIKQTGEPLDLALTNNGFFEVTTDTGPAYTRQGNFRVDASGRLITAKGYPVMGNNGEIYLSTQSPVIDTGGNVTEPDATTGPAATGPTGPIAQLKVVRFDNPTSMRGIGDGLMAAGTGMTAMNPADIQLRQGALENSNVNPISEMTQMMIGVRHFESMQKIVQNYDDMMGTAIQKLGGLS